MYLTYMTKLLYMLNFVVIIEPTFGVKVVMKGELLLVWF